MNKVLYTILLTASVLLSSSTAFTAGQVVVIPLNTCGDGLTKCSGKCVDTLNNPNYCGACTTVCGPDLLCSQGICRQQTGTSCITHADCLSQKCISGTCAEESKFVFVSSVAYTGNLGGLSGADQKCSNLASAAGLPGEYKAWLSDSTSTPATRFNQSHAPYKRVDGTVVAVNWTDLIDGTLLAAISITELGISTGTIRPWTNTTASGNIYFNGMDCDNWSAESNVLGYTGQNNSTTSLWSSSGFSYLCNQSHNLYCFEQ